MMPIRLLVFVFGSIFILRENLSAATTRVASVSALQTAINNAAPGDTIILVDGVYTTHQNIVVKKKGTESDPIVTASGRRGSGIERRFFSYTHNYIQFRRVNTAAYLLDCPVDINIYSYAY